MTNEVDAAWKEDTAWNEADTAWNEADTAWKGARASPHRLMPKKKKPKKAKTSR